MNNRVLNFYRVAGIALCILLGSCAGRHTRNTPAADSAIDSQASNEMPIGAREGNEFSDQDNDSRIPPQYIVYFDFDSSQLRPEFHEALKREAERLSNNEHLMLRLEGHTDERGTREYNIGLGERRAQVVRRALLLSGARDTQLSTVSYGEERPARLGQSEADWRLNRRVELIYVNRPR